MKNTRNTFHSCGNRCLTLLFIFALMASVTFVSCDDFVDVGQPSSQLPSAAVFEDNTTATAAMVAIYAQLRSTGLLTGSPSGMPYKMGEYTDELIFFGAGGQTDTSFPNSTVLANNNTVLQWWNATYSQVYAANAVLEGIANSTALNSAQKDRLRGEALFVRALLHFQLANIYGDVPYIETTDYQANATVSRMPVADVFAKATADLLISEALLEEDYITFDRVRPNKATVQALLARIYLYNGQWAEAAEMASAVLNNTALYGTADLGSVFLKDSPTTIWHLAPATAGENTYEAASHVFESGPPPVSSLSGSLVNAFEAGDQRRALWVKEVTDGTDTWYHAYKYKEIDNTGSSVEYSIIFRTAELYLIRAEARARQGELSNAKEDLDAIRNTAGLGASPAITQDEILTAIEQERRAELFTEGYRFFDLKRTGRLDAVLGSKTGWETTDRLLPVPETELLLNPNLNPQNAGY